MLGYFHGRGAPNLVSHRARPLRLLAYVLRNLSHFTPHAHAKRTGPSLLSVPVKVKARWALLLLLLAVGSSPAFPIGIFLSRRRTCRNVRDQCAQRSDPEGGGGFSFLPRFRKRAEREHGGALRRPEQASASICSLLSGLWSASRPSLSLSAAPPRPVSITPNDLAKRCERRSADPPTPRPPRRSRLFTSLNSALIHKGG